MIMENQNMMKKQNCYIYTECFIVCIKTDYIHKDIGNYVETRFNTSSCDLNRPIPKGKNTKVIGVMKDELSAKIM